MDNAVNRVDGDIVFDSQFTGRDTRIVVPCTNLGTLRNRKFWLSCVLHIVTFLLLVYLLCFYPFYSDERKFVRRDLNFWWRLVYGFRTVFAFCGLKLGCVTSKTLRNACIIPGDSSFQFGFCTML